MSQDAKVGCEDRRAPAQVLYIGGTGDLELRFHDAIGQQLREIVPRRNVTARAAVVPTGEIAVITEEGGRADRFGGEIGGDRSRELDAPGNVHPSGSARYVNGRDDGQL